MLIAAINVSEGSKTPRIACVSDDTVKDEAIELVTKSSIDSLRSEIEGLKKQVADLKR